MVRYLPLVLAVVAIGIAASWDAMVNSGSNIEAETWAKALETLPKEIGPWKGVDHEVEADNLFVAGATGHVSRTYTNEKTNQAVSIWLIVGHMQGVVRHTPNVCYKASGFTQGEKIGRYTMAVDGQEPADFFTSYFNRESELGLEQVRVFWAWTKPQEGQPIQWMAPGNPRQKFAATKALFKLYFTSVLADGEQPLEDNESNEFAKVFLPVINGLLEKGLQEAAPAETAAVETADDATPEA